jgi:hypothetical protein
MPAERRRCTSWQVEPREGQVLGADHHRQQEVAEHRRDRRDQEEEDHDDAVHGEQLVVGVGLDQVAAGVSSSRRISTANSRRREERRDRDQVQDRDPLVVLRQQPRRSVCRGSGSAVGSFVASRLVPGLWLMAGPRRRSGRGRAGRRAPPGASARMYSMSCSRSVLVDEALEGRHERL